MVIGQSNIVGRPMALELLMARCTVTICHSATRDLPGIVRQADIVVAAVGKAKFVPGDWIKPGAIVIDVGINRLPDGKLCGDVDFAARAIARGVDHAGAGRRRAHDDRDAARQHAAGGGTAGRSALSSPEPTIAAVVREQTGVAWSRARRLCTEGRVMVDGQRCLDPAARVAPGAVVTIDRHAPKLRSLPLAESAIVFCDRDVVVVDKPAGMLSVADEPGNKETLVDYTRTLIRQSGMQDIDTRARRRSPPRPGHERAHGVCADGARRSAHWQRSFASTRSSASITRLRTVPSLRHRSKRICCSIAVTDCAARTGISGARRATLRPTRNAR